MIDDRTDITPDAALAALAAPLFVENDGEGALFLRGLGLHVEINLAEPGTRYNPDGPGILAQPDAMEGIVGYGATREAAALACRDRMLELLRTPAEMFDALAEGAERAATIEWAEAERTNHKDTPLNNEAHWHVIQRGSMQTAAKLVRASLALAAGLDRSKPPPGYGVFEWENDDDDALWVFQLADEAPPDGYRGRRSSDRARVVAWAWEHFDDRRALAERERVKPWG